MMTPLGSLDWRLARSGTVPWNARPSIGVSRESGFFSVQRPRAVFTLVVGLLPNTQQHIKAMASHYYWPRERQRERQRERITRSGRTDGAREKSTRRRRARGAIASQQASLVDPALTGQRALGQERAGADPSTRVRRCPHASHLHF